MGYEYSKLEQIVAITDPLGNRSRYDYDLKERLIGVHRHGRVREEYVYDEGDHFVEKRDGEGRVLFENTPHPNHLVGVRKLASGGEHRYDYDERGRIAGASTEAREVKLRYDGLGRRTSDKCDDRGVQRRHRGESAVETTGSVSSRGAPEPRKGSRGSSTPRDARRSCSVAKRCSTDRG